MIVRACPGVGPAELGYPVAEFADADESVAFCKWLKLNSDTILGEFWADESEARRSALRTVLAEVARQKGHA